MSKYLLIESTEPKSESAPGGLYEVAGGLAALGHEVTLFLVQNATLAARHGAKAKVVPRLAAAGVTIAADEFSLRERGIRSGLLAAQVQPQSLDVIVDELAAGSKTLWH